jgi:hypothetical protein
MNENVITHPYKMVMLPVGRIQVNHNYQRDEVPPIVKEIVGGFDYHKVNPIKCAYRDGNNYAFDGQNTTLALNILFGAEYRAPVMLYTDLLCAEDEAKLFEEINAKHYRKAITVADEWKSRIFREDPVPNAILRITRANGLDLANDTNKGKVGVVPASMFKTLESLYLSYGEAIFAETMSVFGGAWRYNRDAYRKPILCGLAKFVDAYRGEYKKSDLVKRLFNKGAKDIYNAGLLQSERGYKKYAREILSVYNHGTSVNRLPEKL